MNLRAPRGGRKPELQSLSGSLLVYRNPTFRPIPAPTAKRYLRVQYTLQKIKEFT